MKMNIVSIDFETYSAASLPDVGLANYVADPTFRVTRASVARDIGTIDIDFVFEADPLESLLDALGNPGDYISPAGLWHNYATLSEVTILAAHNAGFEAAVLRHLGLEYYPLFDSAVSATVLGSNRHLAHAARQLLNKDKLDEDRKLIYLFAIPQKNQAQRELDTQVIVDHPDEWKKYGEYCARDAELSRELVYQHWLQQPREVFAREMYYAGVTQAMNETGWPVDTDAVRVMKNRHDANQREILSEFKQHFDPTLNLNSNPQLVAWCKERGVTARSFDKTNVAKMIAKLEARSDLKPGQVEVLAMLRTKRALGGSSLSKLATILDTQHEGRLYDQYMHGGATQSLRTSGRGVQMQNLKRISHMRDMSELYAQDIEWSNEDLEGNLRQVFRAAHDNGLLVVADYAAMESRALAWLAGEHWKVQAYRRGEPIYETLAAKKWNIAIEAVTKDQRTFGKVGELSCGYGAGPVAVKEFAEKMGVTLTEDEAKELVRDWRDACPKTEEFWTTLHNMLAKVIRTGIAVRHRVTNEFVLVLRPTAAPLSLSELNPDAMSVRMELTGPNGMVLSRVFHGVHRWDSDFCYYKPSSLKSGPAWVRSVYLEKEKKTVRYKLYGGKLAGILTQSLCREIFFAALAEIHEGLAQWDNCRVVGQFHDEVVIEWEPGGFSLANLMADIEVSMTSESVIPGLPMAAEVKVGKTYTK